MATETFGFDDRLDLIGRSGFVFVEKDRLMAEATVKKGDFRHDTFFSHFKCVLFFSEHLKGIFSKKEDKRRKFRNPKRKRKRKGKEKKSSPNNRAYRWRKEEQSG